MAIRLIVNADDYGRTTGVSSGIRTAHLDGIVTSTTAMMNMPGVETGLELVQKECPKLGLGVHLVLTSGKPLLPTSKVSSLVNDQGFFPSASGFLNLIMTIDPEQVHLEWSTQVEKFIHLTGKKPDHLDSHHHTSYFNQTLFEIMLELANQIGCAIRPPTSEGGYDLAADIPPEMNDLRLETIPILLQRYQPRKPEHFFSGFYDRSASIDQMFKILADLPDGTSEIMCHPGFADQELIHSSSYNTQRQVELEILKDAQLKKMIRDRKIQLITYGDLKSTD